MIGIITNFNLVLWGEDARRAGEGCFLCLNLFVWNFFITFVPQIE